MSEYEEICYADNEVVKSVIKGFQILDFFSLTNPSLTFSEIKARSGMPNGSLYRFLYTMTMLGVLKFDAANKRYALGYKLILLGDLAVKSVDIMSLAVPYMQDIKSKINETVSFFVRNGHKKVCLYRVESDMVIRYTSLVGAPSCIHAGASGKVLMSGMSKEELDDLERTEGFPPLTANTLTTREAIEAALREVKRLGYAVSYAERHESSAGIGCPIFDKEGRVAACMNITLPSERYDEKKIPEWFKLQREATMEISKRLGYVELPHTG